MVRAIVLWLSVAALAGAWEGNLGAAPASRIEPLGSLELKTWGPRKDVFFERVEIWRKGCDLGYRFRFKRQKGHELKLRLLLSLDAGPDTTPTAWTVSKATGTQEAEGAVATPGCWVKKARTLKRASFEAVGEPPAAAAADGRVFLGRVTFNRWGASGDVFYRHIQTWRKGCRIHYQFLYKRRSAVRRRLRMRLTLDNGELQTPWIRSKTRGWREIVGSVPSPGCFAEKTQSLRSAAFESERY